MGVSAETCRVRGALVLASEARDLFATGERGALWLMGADMGASVTDSEAGEGWCMARVADGTAARHFALGLVLLRRPARCL